jgi:hypothetical protein
MVVCNIFMYKHGDIVMGEKENTQPYAEASVLSFPFSWIILVG